MKKVLTLVLAVALTLCLFTPALATDMTTAPDYNGMPWGSTIKDVMTTFGSPVGVDIANETYVRFVYDSDFGQICFMFLENALDRGITFPNAEQGLSTLDDAMAYLTGLYGEPSGSENETTYWTLGGTNLHLGTSTQGGIYFYYIAASTAPSGAIEITAVDLLAAYDENAIGADAAYKDQLLAVTGVVNTIDTDILGNAYVTLSDGGKYSIIGVQCYFADEHLDSLGELRSGDTVTIIGTCTGKIINVGMEDCYLSGSAD